MSYNYGGVDEATQDKLNAGKSWSDPQDKLNALRGHRGSIRRLPAAKQNRHAVSEDWHRRRRRASHSMADTQDEAWIQCSA